MVVVVTEEWVMRRPIINKTFTQKIETDIEFLYSWQKQTADHKINTIKIYTIIYHN